MAKIIKLTESDLRRIVKKVIKEQRSNLKEAVPAIAVAGASAAVTGLAGLAVAIVSGRGSSDEKVKQFVDLCAKSNSPITANSNKLADQVRDAVQGLGTNEQNIYSIFGGALDKTRVKTMDEFCSVVKSYQASYDVSLYDDLDDDIDEESVWVQIYRPIRDIALRDQQNQKLAQSQTQPKPQGVTNATVQAAKNTPQPTTGGARPTTGGAQSSGPRPTTTAQSPTSRMPVR